MVTGFQDHIHIQKFIKCSSPSVKERGSGPIFVNAVKQEARLQKKLVTLVQ